MTDIDPTTIVINGVAFPDAVITADPVDQNGDGIPDAIITISPRSAIGLTNTTTSLTITGRTLATSPGGSRVFTGTAAITVSGGGGGGGGGGVLPSSRRASSPRRNSSRRWASGSCPSSRPSRGSTTRRSRSRSPSTSTSPSAGSGCVSTTTSARTKVGRDIGSRHDDRGDGVKTLGRDVFTRGFFKPGKKVVFTHPERVIPTYRQTERFN